MERVELTGTQRQRFIGRVTDVADTASVLRLWVGNGLTYTLDAGTWSPPIGDLRTDE